MNLLQPLCLLAVEQLTGCAAAGQAAGVFHDALRRHLTDHSRRLPDALRRSCRNAWKALELALAGESLADRLRSLISSGDRRAFAGQVRTFLDSCPPLEGVADPASRRACLRELRLAERRGLLDAPLDGEALARRAGEFSRFASPTELLNARRQAIAAIASGLREAGLADLARFVGLREGERPGLLVLGVRFFFRREVERDGELARGLAFSQLEGIDQAQQSGFAALSDLLAGHAETLEQLLGDLHALAARTHEGVLDVREEQRRQGGQLGQLYEAVLELKERLKVSRQEVSPRDCHSVGSESDAGRIRDVKTRYWSLPDDQRRQAPALGNAVGTLDMAAGDYPDAERVFTLVANATSDEQAQAVAHLNAHQAALQQGRWDEALAHFRTAISVGGTDLAPFPVGRYRPERILGAGGFGVAFLCRHARTDALVVVKAIQGGQPDRDVGDVFREAAALEQVDHPGIIRVRDCDYADPEGRTRPYLVMDYFDGQTLAEYVRCHGPLAPTDFLQVAALVASALAAAHARGVLHRDVKPANVLVRLEGGRWQVKVIDFGLAMRLRSVQETVARPQAMQHTLLGQSIAGTIDYAAPEQMGRLPGVAVSPASDVFGFGRTCCFALFGTPQPGPRHWRELTDGRLTDLLGDCLAEQPGERPGSFEDVVAVLAELGCGPTAPAPRPAALPPPDPGQDVARRDLLARIVEGVVRSKQAGAVTAAPDGGPPRAAIVTPPRTEFALRPGVSIGDLDGLVSACGQHTADVERHLLDGSLGLWFEQAGYVEPARRAATVRAGGWPGRGALLYVLKGCGEAGARLASRLMAEEERARQSTTSVGAGQASGDGQPARSVPATPAFHFRSGDTASDLGEFIAACGKVPDDAAWHLEAGRFEPWLRGLGRPDLAGGAEKLRLQAGWTLAAKLVTFLKCCGEQGREVARRVQESWRAKDAPASASHPDTAKQSARLRPAPPPTSMTFSHQSQQPSRGDQAQAGGKQNEVWDQVWATAVGGGILGLILGAIGLPVAEAFKTVRGPLQIVPAVASIAGQLGPIGAGLLGLIVGPIFYFVSKAKKP